MGSTGLNRAGELLGRFSDEMTLVVDRAFGTDWASNEEILALVEIATEDSTSTRRISETSGLHRRAVSRLVVRLRAEGLVEVGLSASDRRVVQVTLTSEGRARSRQLGAELSELFVTSAEMTAQIASDLGPFVPAQLPRGTTAPIDLLKRIAETGVALVEAMPAGAGKEQLSGRQRAALVQIAGHDGVRPGRLSPSLGVTRAGVSYVVDQLCSKGLVRRRLGAVPEDRRAVIIEATAEGKLTASRVTAAIDAQRASLAALFAEIAAWGPGADLRHPGSPWYVEGLA